MRTKLASFTSIAAALILTALAPVAMAEAPKASAAPSTNIAKPAQVTITGKVMSHTEKKDGKDVATNVIMVTEAKDAKMAAIAKLANTSLTVTGPKAAHLDSYKDQEVTATGTLSADEKSIDLNTISAKAPAAAPAAPKAK